MSAPPAGFNLVSRSAAYRTLQRRCQEQRQRHLLGVVRLNTANRTRQFASRTRTEETVMSQLQEDVVPGPGVKTLAVRLNHEMHTQLSVIAQLRGNNIANEIRQAIAAHITALKADPIVVGRAERARQDIEVEAAERRKTLATLFGEDKALGKGTSPRTRKSAEAKPDTA